MKWKWKQFFIDIVKILFPENLHLFSFFQLLIAWQMFAWWRKISQKLIEFLAGWGVPLNHFQVTQLRSKQKMKMWINKQ